MQISEESVIKLKMSLDKVMKQFCQEQGIVPVDSPTITIAYDNGQFLRYDTEFLGLELSE
jgi:hypothetical protein